MRNTKLSYRIIVLLVILSLITGFMPGSRVSAQSHGPVQAKQRFQTTPGVESASILLNTPDSASTRYPTTARRLSFQSSLPAQP
jgi:hypothetical protein